MDSSRFRITAVLAAALIFAGGAFADGAFADAPGSLPALPTPAALALSAPASPALPASSALPASAGSSGAQAFMFPAGDSSAGGTLAFPFDLELGREIALVAAGGGLYASSFYFQSIKASPDAAQIDPSVIPFFDRLYVTNHNAALGYVADGLVGVTALLPAVALPGMSFNQVLDTGVMYVETMGLAIGASSALKALVFRYRPFAYGASPSAFSDPDIASSFPSNHSTLAFASAVFAGYLFDQTHPDSPYRWAVWGAGLGLATLTASIRVVSGDHFLSDVVSGAALGAACGFVVPWLHTIAAKATVPGPGDSKLGLEPLPDGMALKLSFLP